MVHLFGKYRHLSLNKECASILILIHLNPLYYYDLACKQVLLLSVLLIYTHCTGNVYTCSCKSITLKIAYPLVLLKIILKSKLILS